ncbi:MAG: carbon-nitrogen hydrolase family protein [Bacteriovoracaceae bacterium]
MKVALVQICSSLDYKHNLSVLEGLLKEAKVEGASAAFLPECFYSMSDGTKPSPYLVEFENEHFQKIQSLAKKFNIALIGGSVAYESHEEKVLNRAINLDQNGELINFYDKRNLFAIDLKKNETQKKIVEADIYKSGSKPCMVDFNDWKIGINICFDLRFSELAYEYRKNGAEVLTYASAFTRPTGKAHWKTLLRARAIESQCYVIASAQWGEHNERIKTYGHSMIIDPWGEVLVDLEEGDKVSVVEISKEKVLEVRSQVPMMR